MAWITSVGCPILHRQIIIRVCIDADRISPIEPHLDWLAGQRSQRVIDHDQGSSWEINDRDNARARQPHAYHSSAAPARRAGRHAEVQPRTEYRPNRRGESADELPFCPERPVSASEL